MFRKGMNQKESNLLQAYGWKKNELRDIRSKVSEFEGVRLWYREESNKPKHLQTVWWTEVGVFYLTEYFKSVKEMTTPSPVDEIRQMTKTEFDKIVNNSKWIGKVAKNQYRNINTVLVEHDTGFRVIVTCKDNSKLPCHSYVEVDTRNNKHIIRKPHFKSHEKAKQA